ncbi:MAG: T9SS type A sorting domain-containing protein, partial [Bacteroidetes bacterium]|nr:T9SS type A sorting domain-containing protein [Bacteroidota bacterium]
TTLYYRIVGVDNDGKLSYSEVRQLAMGKEQLAISIFPNPAKDVVNISCRGMKQVRIINSLGQQITTGTNLSNNGIIINTKNFSKGLYIVQIITKNNEAKNEKLIVE